MSIIRQSNRLAVVPDLRNLSVLIKILISVHILIIGLAAFNSDSRISFLIQMSEHIVWVEPGLLLTLGALSVVNNWLHRRRYPQWWALAITVSIFLLLNSVLFGGQYYIHRMITVSLTMLGLMHYFALQERARSPALAEARLVALTSRIRPHFLFNSLNAAISLVRLQPEKAEMILENLADLFRAQLAEPGRTSTLENEIELAKMYLSIEQARMGDRLKVTWTIQAPGDTVMPPLLLQPLLENAVYHGIERLREPAEITVSAVLIKRQISIAVLNPIDPGHPSIHDGNKIALKNLAERLALIFDADAELHVNHGTNSFLVRIEFPYRSAIDEPLMHKRSSIHDEDDDGYEKL